MLWWGEGCDQLWGRGNGAIAVGVCYAAEKGKDGQVWGRGGIVAIVLFNMTNLGGVVPLLGANI